MKKLIIALLASAMLFSLCACGQSETAPEPTAPAPTETEVPDEMTASDGVYPIAVVTDGGELRDGAYNESIWDAAKQFAADNGIAYKYYQPAGGATVDDRYEAMKLAAESGGAIVLCIGDEIDSALAKAAAVYPKVNWVWIDGSAATDNTGELMTNTLGISFDQAACGFFAGYAAVKDGFTKLAYSGGGGGLDPACCKYGYGFVQGANAAAAEMGVQVEMKYSWLYGAIMSASPELENLLKGWYRTGTEIIFPCGGTMRESAYSAAEAKDGWTVGLGYDCSGESERVLTSAMKDAGGAAYWALSQFYAGAWEEYGGTTRDMGVADGAILLPTDDTAWRFRSFTEADYQALFDAAMNGEPVIDSSYPEAEGKTMADLEFSNVTVTMVN